MTDFAGNYILTLGYTGASSNPAFGNLDPPDYTEVWDLEPRVNSASAKTSTQPIDEVGNDFAGERILYFAFLDWYLRIHVEPLRIDLGNVVSEQERSLSLWNAFFEPRTLNNITSIDDDGILLELPSPLPIEFAPLQQHFFTFQIATEGPPSIDAHFIFDFDVADFDVNVLGIRIVAWVWEINWVSPMLERLQWKTDVQPAYDGGEQRAALRGGPRVEWEFTFDVKDDQRRTFENVIFGWGARNWALPMWIDVEQLTAPVNAGSTSIPLTTTEGRDYVALGLGIIIAPDGTYEAFGVDSVDPTAVNLQDPLINTWPAGSRVYPARPAALMDPRATGRMHRNYARGLARFRSTQEIEREALDEPLYRDLPVMDREFNWREAPEIEYARKTSENDFEVGKFEIIDQSELAVPIQRVIFTAMSREDSDYLRAWLYARAGRHKGIWMPTWSDDLILASAVSTSSLSIDVEACGLTHFAEGKVHRRDIRVQLKNGTVYYRRVSDFTAPNDLTERMVINTTFPVQIEPEDVERISWMQFVRLDSDSIELTWANQSFAEAALALRGPRNGV